MSNNRNRQDLTLPKNFSSSQINWVGMLTFTISLLGFVQSQELVAQYPKAVSIIGAVIGVLIIALRFIDKQPVRLPLQNLIVGKGESDNDSGPY